MASLGLAGLGHIRIACRRRREPAVAVLGMGMQQVLHTAAFVTGFIFSSLHDWRTGTEDLCDPCRAGIDLGRLPTDGFLLVWPLNYLLNKAAILSLFGVAEATHAEVFSGEEISRACWPRQEHGEIHHQQAAAAATCSSSTSARSVA
ncbi:MAG: hypothetical protein H6962_08380 [Chromatiaceae bacterium]|nr:hypothetical protein [Chromatiaceae bacterium]